MESPSQYIASSSLRPAPILKSFVKEVQEGYIDMKEVATEGIGGCVHFVYTGEVQITSCNIQHLLEASHLLQIDDLVEMCLQYLRDNLRVETSLFTVNQFELYGTTEDQASADQYVIRHFKEIIQTPMFPLIHKKDLKRYLKSSNLNTEIHWQAIIEWLGQGERKEEKRFLTDLVGSLLEMRNCRLSLLVGTIWKHPFVQENEQTKSLIPQAISGKEETLEENMSLEICYLLKNIIKTHDLVNRNYLDKYLAENFGQAIERDEFYDLSAEDLTAIFRSIHLNCQVETAKWACLLKWVKHEKTREKILPNLMKLLDFEKIPTEYIQRSMRNERLVQKSAKCKDILLDACLGVHTSPVSSPLKPDQNALVMLDDELGILAALDIENGNHAQISTMKKVDVMRVTAVRDDLYLLKDVQLYEYSSIGTWKKRSSWVGPRIWYSWDTLPIWSLQVVTFRNKIYVMDQDNMYCYSPSEDTWWNNLPKCGLNRGFCVAASQDSIYALGGNDTSRSGRRFDPEAGKWFEMAPMNVAREFGASAIVYRGKLFVMGSRDTALNYYNSVESYNHTTDSWMREARMNKSRAWFGAVIYNEKLYVIGGGRDDNLMKLDDDSIEVFDQDANEWKIVQKLPRSEGRITACVIKSDIL